LLRELLHWAFELLAAAEPLSRALPWRFALEVRMFAGGGQCVVRRSAALGAQLLTRRPRVGGGDKALIALSALVPTLGPKRKASAILRP
jgi:phytoene/squalene synthetase